MEGPLAIVTGFPRPLARRLSSAYLEREPGARIVLLVQEHDAEEAAAYRSALCAEERERVELLEGDVSAMHLGLSTREYRSVCEGANDVLHAAELCRLSAPRADLSRINVDGTRAALELAADCRRLRRFTHVGTAFVAGDRAGVIAEDELAAGQAFRNAYEETKFEAELQVRRAMGHLPCTVVRPGIIVGDASAGDDRFDHPAAVAVLLVTSPIEVPVPLPGDGVAPLNVAPIGWVAAAAIALHHDPRAVGRTFHLVDPSPASARRVYELVAQRAGRKLPPPSLGYKLADALLRLPVFGHLAREQRTGLRYLDQLSFFATRNTLEVLDGTGIRCPPVESYLDDLIASVRPARYTAPP